MNNKYFIYSEIDKQGWVSVPTKLIYDNWDLKRNIVIESDNGSREVVVGDYKSMNCPEELEYRVSKFKLDNKEHILDEFLLKLINSYKIHHTWFNSLIDVWKSEIFIRPLQHVTKQRSEGQIITPDKSNQLSYFKNRIDHTILPKEITSNSNGVWIPFLNKCKEIQENYKQ